MQEPNRTRIPIPDKKDEEGDTGMAKRRVRGKGDIFIERPKMVAEYNANMGGVDNVDQVYLAYRIATNKKKWWFCFFPWSLNVSAVAAWRLRNKVLTEKGEKLNKKHNHSLINFVRPLARTLIKKHGKISQCAETSPTPAAGTSAAKRPRPRLVHPDDDIRYDGLNHYLIKMEENKVGVCKNCREKENRKARSRFLCEKCNVPLHPECHKSYHIK